MRFLFLNIILLISALNGYQIININKPECKKCIYFEPSNSFSLQSRIEYGTCRYYGEKNLLDGKIKYDYASIARKYKDCGENGTRYIEENKINYELKLRSKLLYDIIQKINQ